MNSTEAIDYAIKAITHQRADFETSLSMARTARRQYPNAIERLVGKVAQSEEALTTLAALREALADQQRADCASCGRPRNEHHLGHSFEVAS